MAQAPVAHVVSLTWVMNTFSQSRSKCAVAIAFINAMSSLGYIGSSLVHSVLLLFGVADASQVLLAVPLGAFIRELMWHMHLDEHHVYCDALGIQEAPFTVQRSC